MKDVLRWKLCNASLHVNISVVSRDLCLITKAALNLINTIPLQIITIVLFNWRTNLVYKMYCYTTD